MAAARLLMEVLEPSEPAVWDVAMRQRAKQLGQHIRAEDGVARAVETFEQIIVQQNNRKRRHKRATGYVPL